jgi:DNA-binding NarL/FixJ family response regulator
MDAHSKVLCYAANAEAVAGSGLPRLAGEGGEMPQKRVLIVAEPGPLRDGLQALAGAVPGVRPVEYDNIESAVRNGHPEGDVALVLLDAGVAGDGLGAALRRMRGKWPDARYIALADDVRQHHSAAMAGADTVLMKGFQPSRLVEIIVRLLPPRQSE